MTWYHRLYLLPHINNCRKRSEELILLLLNFLELCIWRKLNPCSLTLQCEGSMDLPVDEWISYLLDKWASFPKSVQDTISTAETLSDVFLRSSSLLQ